MTFAHALSLAAAFLTVVAAACWPKLPGRLSYILAAIGICWLVYSEITALQAFLGTRLQQEPAALIVLAATVLAAGIFWHIQRANSAPAVAIAARPAARTAKPAKASPTVPSIKTAKASSGEPTLLTLFMADTAAEGTGGPSVQANGYVNLTLADDSKLRVFYTILHDGPKNARFINFYVPESAHTYEACEFIATGHQQVLNQGADPSTGAAFAGRVFVYHETDLSRRQIGRLAKLYAANELKPEFRGASYAASVRQASRREKSQAPSEFVIKDGLIVLAPTTA